MRVPPILDPPNYREDKKRICKYPSPTPPKKRREGHPIHLPGSGILTGTPFGTGEAMVSFCFVAPHIYKFPLPRDPKDGETGTY